MMRRTALLALLAATMAGCANQQADRAQMAQTTLVGMPRQLLLSCAGVPNRTASNGNEEYYTYVTRRTAGYGGPSASVGLGGGSGGVGLGLGIGVPIFGGGGSSGCEATFTLRDGVVRQLVYSSASAGECYNVVENCLPPAAP